MAGLKLVPAIHVLRARRKDVMPDKRGHHG
jgi:hypothetical protein